MPLNKSLTLSIVIPVYNEEDYLKACLDSIAAQTVKPSEVIVVDNNSTDKTVEIAKSYSFVRLLTEHRQGVLFARNKGFDAATSDVIGRVDADTQLEKTWVEVVLERFVTHNEAAITGPVCYYDIPFSKQNIKVDHFFRSRIYKHYGQFPFLFGTNMAIRKQIWQEVKAQTCVRRDMFEDTDLAIHVHNAGYECVYYPEMRGGMSSRRYDDSLKQFYRYISLYDHTYYSHGFHGPMPKVSIVIYLVFYVLMWPVRRSYNQGTRRRSFRQLRRGHISRKHPMDDL